MTHVTSKRREIGFTLLELLAVLTVIALVAAIAVTRLGGVYSRSALDTTLSNLATFDERSRALSYSKQCSLTMRFDLTKGEAFCQQERETLGRKFVLPPNMQFERFHSVREQKSSGEATVRLCDLGTGETYALKVTTASGQSRWIVFAGGSGQIIEVETSRDVEKLFRALKT